MQFDDAQESITLLHEDFLPQTSRSMTQGGSNRAPLGPNHQFIKRWLLILSVLFFVSMGILFHMDLKMDKRMILPGVYLAEPIDHTEGFAINTKGCRIPQLNPIDPSIVRFLEVSPEDEIVCDVNGTGILVDSNLTSIFINPMVVSAYTSDPSALKCCYESFHRELFQKSDDYRNGVDRTFRYSNHCIPFKDSAVIQDNFIRVTCTLHGKVVYKDFFAFVLPSRNQQPQLKKDSLNVLILGIDAVSKMNFVRQLPNTYKYIIEDLKGIDMQGYNKVGDNTFPNLVPVLSGLSEEELKETCWPNSNSVFDGCPFIWNIFKGKGFTTGYGEDSANIGLFNYQKLGFHEEPTDFYLQTFNIAAESAIGHEKRLNCKLCIGKRLNIQVLLDIVKKFAFSLKDIKSFGFFWETSLSHDFLNLPRYGDASYVTLLKELKSGNILNDTVLIMLSDHGIRWGGIRYTYQGYLEERLPFLFFVFPDWFAEKYSKAAMNIKQNRGRLTTPFDLHETLRDLSDLNRIKEDELSWRSKDPQLVSWKQRGISLFLKISGDRTCQNAGIPDNWCTCHQSEAISIEDNNVKLAGDELIKNINKMLSNYKECAELKLVKIHSARREVPLVSPNDTIQGNIQLVDYTLSLETTPGNALFEATVRQDKFQEIFYVVGIVSRLNTYGSQSNCMLDYKLKLYCFCTSFLS